MTDEGSATTALEPLAENIWLADGPSVPFLGIPYPTRMAVIRLANGDLWIWSPVKLNAELAQAVGDLGRVRHLVSPNKLHHLYLGEWKLQWPEARMYASPGLARRRTDLRFDAELGEGADAAWAGEIDQVVFRGSFAMDEIVFFHRASSTALFTDLIQKFDPNTVQGWKGLFLRLDGLVGIDGSTPREWRLSFWNRAAARRAVATVLSWQPRHLVLAHGTCVTKDGAGAVRRSLRWLKPDSDD